MTPLQHLGIGLLLGAAFCFFNVYVGSGIAVGAVLRFAITLWIKREKPE